MFTAALFTIAKTWKQPKCPSKNKWIKKIIYIYTYTYIYIMEYYSAIKKNEIMPFAVIWMDLELITLSEVSQTKTNIIPYHLYVESKKKDTNELIYKTETDSQTLETNLRLPKGKRVGGIN